MDLIDSSRGLLEYLQSSTGFDLIIIDPDMPDFESDALLMMIGDRMPGIAVIIHTYLSDFKWEGKKLAVWAQVEKKGNSIDSIRSIIKQLPDFMNA